jgi:hypothetical protein
MIVLARFVFQNICWGNNVLFDSVGTWPSALAIRVSLLACEAYRVLLVATIVVYLRLYITSTDAIIGAMMDRGVIRR